MAGGELPFALPGTLKVIVYPAAWLQAEDKEKYYPIWDQRAFAEAEAKSGSLNFVLVVLLFLLLLSLLLQRFL